MFRQVTHLLLLVVMSVVALSGAPGPARAQMEIGTPQDAEYRARPGDRVTVEFYTPPGEPLDVTTVTKIVNSEGSVFLPYVGEVSVGGLTSERIRMRLQELYAAFFTDAVVDASVELRVDVTGTVRSPGTYFVEPGATLVHAVAEAGGAAFDLALVSNQVPSDPSKVQLVRDGAVRILDIRPEYITPDVLNLRVESGDWIFVPSRRRLRDEIRFWGSVGAVISSIIAVAVVIAN